MSDGLVVVDKPGGLTSHDVVGRVRRLARTRRVGHAGTLDPMATGVLVLGVGQATRLLGHLTGTDKAYDATVRLGTSTVSDDATGDVLERRGARGVTEEQVRAGAAALTGDLLQVPSAVSAVKVDGKRAYALVRAGEDVALAARPVRVDAFDVHALRPVGDELDVDVTVRCSSGTYVRALARDLGAALGTGGHLTALRRTAVGPYDLAVARTLEQLEDDLALLPLADAVERAFPRVDVDAEQARLVAHGVQLRAEGPGGLDLPAQGPAGFFGPDGALLALGELHRGRSRYLAVFAG
ncbi:tRNA pseudouridine(55) synthase TruB [Vallicoccus soli]|uniref:tRNA pseudouridine synthase B n=1 Tax=Vallicoccus soli TaxID=2339232 RepID=A0A3A3Z1L5_9ACTN|nr:tRNA pseudouridine(55) synthase TruB [Vallicoccus soli]RJK96492.1 tRNA pseudouridine(55) synthase TruB [Vallicoccus soli]